MKFSKLKRMSNFFTFILLIFLSTNALAQNNKSNKKLTKQVININKLITSQDNSLALSEEQMTKMNDLFKEKFKEVKEIKKSDKADNKDALKALNQKYYKKIFKGILSNEQLKAYNKGRKESKKKNQ